MPSRRFHRNALACLLPLLPLLPAAAADSPAWAAEASRQAGTEPAIGTTRRPSPATTPVSLQIATVGGVYGIWVENPLHGPVEVLVDVLDASDAALAIRATPALPARASVAARGQALLAHLDTTARAPRLRMKVVPGAPAVRVRDVEYRFPLQMAAPRITQGYGGQSSHDDAENLHAVDFAAPIGTPVLAARAGVVMDVSRGADRGGPMPGSRTSEANAIRILHDDGSMALYAHLDEGGVLVQPGQRVRLGEVIGRSGNTGFSSGPHLHFVVQANRSLRLESVPFRMFGPQGILRFSMPPATTGPARDGPAATASPSPTPSAPAGERWRSPL